MATRADRLTQTQKKRELYSDFLGSFAKHPLSGDLARVTNEESVKQSVKNILLTNLGERPFEPHVGGDVRRAAFEPSTGFTDEIVACNVREALDYSEPRISVLEIKVVASPDSNDLRVSVTFVLVNDRVPLSVDVIVKRV